MNKLSSDILIEFLEVTFHNLIYVSEIYPKEIFESRKKYGAPVKYSIHPQLNSYILNTLNGVKEILATGFIDKIALCFMASHDREIRRFVFEIGNKAKSYNNDDPYLIKCEQNFRAYCLKLAHIKSLMVPLPEDSTFSIKIYTRESSAISLINNPDCEKFPLIEIDSKSSHVNSRILPIGSIDIGGVVVQTYTESQDEQER